MPVVWFLIEFCKTSYDGSTAVRCSLRCAMVSHACHGQRVTHGLYLASDHASGSIRSIPLSPCGGPNYVGPKRCVSSKVHTEYHGTTSRTTPLTATDRAIRPVGRHRKHFRGAPPTGLVCFLIPYKRAKLFSINTTFLRYPLSHRRLTAPQLHLYRRSMSNASSSDTHGGPYTPIPSIEAPPSTSHGGKISWLVGTLAVFCLGKIFQPPTPASVHHHFQWPRSCSSNFP